MGRQAHDEDYCVSRTLITFLFSYYFKLYRYVVYLEIVYITSVHTNNQFVIRSINQNYFHEISHKSQAINTTSTAKGKEQ